MSSATPSPTCPICGRPRKALHRPFCSARCRKIDLGRWFTGAYAVPSAEPPDGVDEDAWNNLGMTTRDTEDDF